ncbi:MAG: co-chaperone GroES [Betaproteobacteria bacterium]|nr:co-chaperone GroES [Betaproteobacteria bacterium]
MKLRPLHDRLVIKRLDEVLAVGNGKILEDGKVRALDVKVGDKVLFGKYSGQTVKVDGDELLVLREDDVMAVIA